MKNLDLSWAFLTISVWTLAFCIGCGGFSQTLNPPPIPTQKETKLTKFTTPSVDNGYLMTITHDGEEYIVVTYRSGVALMQKPKSN